MFIFGFMRRCLRQLWRTSGNLHTGIDSHRWESKTESFRSLSREQYLIPELKDKYPN
jgi:hypothetical protein